MKFKISAVVGAVLAVGSASTFAAAAAVVCPGPKTGMTDAEAMAFVNKCSPESTLFIGGASTMKDNLQTLILSDILDTTKMTPIPVKDAGSTSGKNGNVKAWYGIGKVGTAAGKRVFVVYNYNNGSAAGVSQLLGKPAAENVTKGNMLESNVVSVGLDAKKLENTCTIGTASVAAVEAVAEVKDASGNVTTAAVAAKPAVPATIACTAFGPKQADIALSDVAPRESYKLYPSATGKLSTLTSTPLFLQSFGVVVSPKLYTALAVKNVADGLLASSCVVEGVAKTTPDCQPNISRADYASLVTKVGGIKSLAALTGNAALTDKLVLARRDDLSGTQSSSNIFFTGLQCAGSGVKGLVKGVMAFTGKSDLAIEAAGGNVSALPIVSSTDTFAGLTVQANAVGDGVKNAVADAEAYAIGVVGVGSGGTIKNTDTAKTAVGRFVKIDGISPNYLPLATSSSAVDWKTPLATGLYPFAMTTYAITTVAAVGATAKDVAGKVGMKDMLTTLVNGMKSSTKQAPLNGIVYFDGAANSVQSKVERANGNNCSPLVTKAVAVSPS